MQTYIAKNVDNITSSTTMYSVTSGKMLLISSWGGTIKNTSTTAAGHVRLRDGGIEGPIIASWNLPTAVAGTIAPVVRIQVGFPLAKRFSNDLFFEVMSGTTTICFQFTGMEE